MGKSVVIFHRTFSDGITLIHGDDASLNRQWV